MRLRLTFIVRISILMALILSNFSGLLTAEETIHLKTQRFKFFDDRIEFYDHTEVIKGSFKLVSEDFIIRRVQEEARFVDAQNGVYIEFDAGTATSQILDYDLQEEKGVLKGGVEAFIRPQNAEDEVRILCDEMSIDTRAQLYSGHVNQEDIMVRIYRGDLYAECTSFVYDGQTETITMIGKVYIEDPKNNRRLWAQKAILSLQDDTLEAENATMELMTSRAREEE